jgi:hypothetical protein
MISRARASACRLARVMPRLQAAGRLFIDRGALLAGVKDKKNGELKLI